MLHYFLRLPKHIAGLKSNGCNSPLVSEIQLLHRAFNNGVHVNLCWVPNENANTSAKSSATSGDGQATTRIILHTDMTGIIKAPEDIGRSQTIEERERNKTRN